LKVDLVGTAAVHEHEERPIGFRVLRPSDDVRVDSSMWQHQAIMQPG
jgi:hypothetical protein